MVEVENGTKMDRKISELVVVFFVGFALLLTHYRARLFAANQEEFKVVQYQSPTLAVLIPGPTGGNFLRRGR